MGPKHANSDGESAAITAFAHVTTDDSPLYRAIMRVFVESSERFRPSLSPEDVIAAVHSSSPGQVVEPSDIEAALRRLCEWGNLQSNPATTFHTAADSYKQRDVFQMTSRGAAVERALAAFQNIAFQNIETSEDDLTATTALTDVAHALEQLNRLSREEEPDAGRIRRNLIALRSRFEDFTFGTQRLIASLEQGIGLAVPEMKRLIDRAEEFLSDFVIAADRVAESIRDIEAAGFERLLQALAHHQLRDGIVPMPENTAAIRDQWRSHWEHFCNWFVSRPGCPSNAVLLREHIRSSMPVLLRVITSLNDRKIYRVDRSNDFRVLARWFAEAESDAEAHRLWKTVFGLCPARHLAIDDASLDDFEAQDVPADTSWLDAPPVRISMRARVGDPHTGMLSRIIDRTSEKEKLAATAHDEALRILSAQARFGSGRRMRLSELELLEAGEFDLFLDLLGDATSIEVVSDEGFLRVKLEPTNDGREAAIATTEGIFSGPDHWISIEREEVV